MRNIGTIDLADLVPDSIRSDTSVAAATAAINAELKAVSNLCMAPAIYSRIDQLGSRTLDHLAWQVDSKVWRDTWPLSLKRSVIRGVILEKAKKGTRASMEAAIASLGSAVVIREWFDMDPPGDPHTFDVLVSVADVAGALPGQMQQDILLRIDDTKPARAHYTLSLAAQAMGEMYLAGAARPVIYNRMNTQEQI